MPGMFFPPSTSKENASQRSRHASRHVRPARAVMHFGIAKRGQLFRHSRRMRNLQFYVSCRGPLKKPDDVLLACVDVSIMVIDETIKHFQLKPRPKLCHTFIHTYVILLNICGLGTNHSVTQSTLVPFIDHQTRVLLLTTHDKAMLLSNGHPLHLLPSAYFLYKDLVHAMK